MKVVIDTSVIGHYFFYTSAAGAIEEQLRRSSLVAPSFLHIEFRQVLWKHMRNLCDADARHILSLFEEIPIRLVPDMEIRNSALDIAARLGITMYDALYAALAEQENIPLLTADKRLAAALDGSGITVNIA